MHDNGTFIIEEGRSTRTTHASRARPQRVFGAQEIYTAVPVRIIYSRFQQKLLLQHDL